VWNNLRARHYSVLILLAIVALETSAIAIDRFINRESDTAFAIESPYQNNLFIQNFKVAEASCKQVPVALSKAVNSTPAKMVAAAIPAPEVGKVEKVVKAPFIAAASKPATDKVYIEYAVQPGDSLSHIARMFGSETDLIKKANELEDKHVIKAGETIKIPLPNSEMTYKVRPGDSLSKIAGKFRVPLESLITHNSLKSHMLQEDQQIRIPVRASDRELKMIQTREAPRKFEQQLSLDNTGKPALIKSAPKFKPVRTDKIQIAQAQAPAIKPDIKFIEKELLAKPPVVANVKKETTPILRASAVIPEPVITTKVDIQKPAPTATPAVEKLRTEKQMSYKVQKGDNLLKIALRFNTTVAQIKSENKLQSNFLKIGEELKISPDKKLYRVVKEETAKDLKKDTTLISHQVKKGESLSLLARKYNTTISAIIADNNLNNSLVTAGQILKIKADKKKYVVTQTNSITRKMMRMPTRGRLSDRYGWRNHPVYRKRLFHAGIDIAAPKGAPITAAMSGKVIYAGRRSGYGKLVIISHANGYSTRYAHCSSILVKKGQTVKAGQLVARVGATGVATGNHLHFEVRKNGKTQNPLLYLN